MDNFKIFPSSPELTASGKYNFPWDTIECGQSFAVPKDEIKLLTLRPMATAKGKKLNKKFRVVEHDDCYEVGRLA